MTDTPSANRSSTPWPLGVHLGAEGDGARAAVFAAHAEAVEVCLFEGPAGEPPRDEQRVTLPHCTDGVWHGLVPGARAGQRYGLRVHGPWDPDEGHRHNPAKVLLDPYARLIEGETNWGQAVFGHAVDDQWRPVDGHPTHGGARHIDPTDSAGAVPLGVLVPPHAPATSSELGSPAHRWDRTVVYEAHLRGLTMRHPAVPEGQRGTWAGLAHPAVVEYLVGLGVTAVELLPVFAIGDEAALVRRGTRNYWGYNTLSFFAPEPRYVSAAARVQGPAAVLGEVSTAVQTLHAAGLEVLLDVVYNHTCEAGADGPTLSWRGLDNASYYRLDEHGRDVDVTGCGNTLDFSHPRVVAMALDSLRYWVQTFGVDGFRFDLAPALARGGGRREGYDPDHPFLVAARTDPVLQRTKLVAEPWDLGTHGWRTGQFPPPFAEWNDRFRDGVRSFWLADVASTRAHWSSAGHPRPRGDLSELATRMAGSSDYFSVARSADLVTRSAWASVNFVTAHDGFTLADTVAYEQKHNEANGEGNRDGHSDNRTWNHGVEGVSDDAQLLAERRASVRALLGTLLLSTGTPMLTAGDERYRSQGGNNNAYCIDDETTWLDWSDAPEADDLTAHLHALLDLRRRHAVLRRAHRPDGRQVHTDGTTDLAWFGPDGTRMDDDRWHEPSLRTLAMFLHGEPVRSDSVLVLVQGQHEPVEVTLPGPPWASRWELLWDSGVERPDGLVQVSDLPGEAVTVAARTVRLYRARP